MNGTLSISETIRERYSCRTYRPEPVAAGLIAALQSTAAACVLGPLGSEARFRIVAAAGDDPDALRGLGTYGFISRPAGFIMGAARNGPKALEDFGYLMERLVLRATELGLGTCWLGGSFTRTSFSARLDLRGDETMPAVVSFGYPADQRRLLDRLIRRTASGDRRLPWEQLFFDGMWDAPLAREAAGAYALPLDMVRIGPSASNKQPWRVLRQAEAWHLYLKRTSGYPPSAGRQILKVVDLQRNDVGIAMCHWALTVGEAGLPGAWELADPGVPVPDSLVEYVVTWRPH